MGEAFDSFRTIRVPAKDGVSGTSIQLEYSHQKVIGNGSFGVVYHIKMSGDQDAAVKKVLQDRRYKVKKEKKKKKNIILTVEKKKKKRTEN